MNKQELFEHPLRSQIVDALLQAGRPTTVAGLQVLTRAPLTSVSRACEVLAEAGVVERRHEGKHTYVSLPELSAEKLAWCARQARAALRKFPDITPERFAWGLRVGKGLIVDVAQVEGWLEEDDGPPERSELN